jgi:hypothetical protein
MAGTQIKQEDDHDIVWGTPAIGRVINREPRAVEYMMKRYPDFPVKKAGGSYVASRKALLAYVIKMAESA